MWRQWWAAYRSQSLYAVSYTVPGDRGGPAFVISGVPEEEPGDLEAMLDSMVRVLTTRMAELGVSWEGATAIQLYGVEVVQGLLADYVLRHLGPSAVHGHPLVSFPSAHRRFEPGDRRPFGGQGADPAGLSAALELSARTYID